LILFIFINLEAQNPAIVDPAKRWSYFEHDGWLPWNYHVSYYVKFSGDTIINQLNYLKIWESIDENYLNWYHRGFIRSDTNGNIYLRNLLNEEGLAYKFDVNPGDTFSVINPFHFYTFIAEVEEVDQVYIEPANEYRNRIKIIDYEGNSWGDEEYWIEGIGSLAGILHSGFHLYSLTGGEYDVLCQWVNNTLEYSNQSFNFCFNIVSTPEISDEPISISIQPNPLVKKSQIIIKGVPDEKYKLVINDIYGKNTCEYNIQQNKDILLDRGLFKNGLYIIALFDGNNIIARKKLIVQ